MRSSYRFTRAKGVFAIILGAFVLVGLTAGQAAPAGKVKHQAVMNRASTVIFDNDQGVPADPTNFNPWSPNTDQSFGLVQAIFEPLFITNVITGQQEPWLATNMTPSNGFKTWTLTLRPGVKWSDGKPFTADDVIFSVQLLQKYSDLNAANKFPGVKMKKTSSLTVVFTLPAADPRFELNNFSTVLASKTFYVVPKHIWSGLGDPIKFTNYDPSKGWPVGTGAYKVASVTPTSRTFVRNDKWWGSATGFKPLPAPKTLIWQALGTEETRAAAIASNDMDEGANFTVGAYQALVAQNSAVSAWTSKPPYGFFDVCPRSLDFNTLVQPWNDPTLRWAVNEAINRGALNQITFQGSSIGSLGPFPVYPALNTYVNLLKKQGVFKKYPISTVSIAKAKSAIESLGYTLQGNTYQKNGQTLSLEITAFNDPTMLAIAQGIAQELQKVGINATVRTLSVPNFINDLLAGTFQSNVFFGACGSSIDPWQSMDAFNVSHFVPAGQNIAGFYSNSFRWNTGNAQAYSQIVDSIGKLAPGDPKIGPLFVKAMSLWYADLPSIPLLQFPQLSPTNSKYWTGWPTAKNPYIQPTYNSAAAIVTIDSLKPAK